MPAMDPNEDTEWNDILRKHGILPQQVKITQNDIYDSAVEKAQEEESRRLENLDLDELDELEDEEDDRILEFYRQQRLAEMQAHLDKEKFECKLMNRILSELAQQYRATKFVKIVSVECIHNYPDANLPTLLVYGKGDMQGQLVRLDRFGGMRTKRKTLRSICWTWVRLTRASAALCPTRTPPTKRATTILQASVL
ncbi:thioredoxin-like protein [Kickxella alabastrina]|uniref:thioredoxin-like protein n=1 Tax=Kickxella alabastrina TaxID=61397 RepID=UPI0022208436|nr:thioredoxin-like protein [Kickxella alabastrina]KAI7830999.1 thioredoxin-like protein [Kickxella alabastrina]